MLHNVQYFDDSEVNTFDFDNAHVINQRHSNKTQFQDTSDPDLLKLCKQFVTRESSMVDVGAQDGSYSIGLSQSCKNIHAFESKHYILEKNLNERNISNVIVHDSTPKSKLDLFNLRNIDLIKLNSEYSTLNFLSGAINTLKENDYPPLIFEPKNNERQSVFDFLHKLNYRTNMTEQHHNIFTAIYHQQSGSNQNKNISGYSLSSIIIIGFVVIVIVAYIVFKILSYLIRQYDQGSGEFSKEQNIAASRSDIMQLIPGLNTLPTQSLQ